MTGFRPVVLGAMGLLPAALTCFVSLSFLASIAIPVYKLAEEKSVAGWSAGLLYLFLVGGAVWLLARLDVSQEKHAVAWMIGMGVALKTAAVLFFPALPFNTDQSLFHEFAHRLAQEGFGHSVLSSLSAYYDYPLWAGRVFPVHYLVQRFAGSHAFACLKALNILVSSLILLIAHDLACHVIPHGKRKWAVFLLLVLPFQTFWVTDYSHHLYSSFYLLIFAWCACKLTVVKGQIWHQICLSGLATACLLLMAWQGGVDWIALGVAGGIVAMHFVLGTDMRHSMLLAFFLLIVPSAGMVLLKGPLLMDRVKACDMYRQNSVLPAFMARGWCPQTGGEYHRQYERLDQATPWPRKATAMYRLVVSQMRHEPLATCFLLPGIKTAKLFLVGYASNIEESLTLANSSALPSIRAVRRCGTIVFLLFVLLGCLHLSAEKELSLSWLPVLLVPLLTWGAYVLGGETSPRYSVFCQPFLAIAGACAFSGIPDCGSIRRVCLSRILLIILLMLLVAGLVVFGLRMMPSYFFYEDFRSSQMDKTTDAGVDSPFERTVELPEGSEQVSMIWQIPHGATGCSFYSLQCIGSMEGATLEVFSQDGDPLTTIPVGKHDFPEFEEFSLPVGLRQLQVVVSRPASASLAPGTYGFGYLLWGMP